MPVSVSSVGLWDFPLAAGALDSPLNDPLLDGLVAYLTTWLRFDLDAKFANLRGTASSAVSAGPYAFDPFGKPSQFFTRPKGDGSAPQQGVSAEAWTALFAWRESMKPGDFSTMLDVNDVVVKVAWVMSGPRGQGLRLPEGWQTRSGLFGAISSTITRAMSIGHHEQHHDDEYIGVLLKLAKDGIYCTDVTPRVAAPIQAGGGADNAKVLGYPAVVATFAACEPVGAPTPGPLEFEGDGEIAIEVGDDGDNENLLPVLTRGIPGGPFEEDS